MPLGNQFENLAKVLKAEKALRKGHTAKTPPSLPEYWQDIIQLLRIHKADQAGATSKQIKRLRMSMHSDAYGPYIETKQRKAQNRERQRHYELGDTLFPL